MSPMLLGAIIVSVCNSVAFFAALVIAYMSKDSQNLGLLIGAVITNATTVVAFWLGSSAGSAHKTDIMASSPAFRTSVPPPPPIMPPSTTP